jgi:hypothetical protein
VKDHDQGRLRVYVHLVVSTVIGCPTTTNASTVILLGFNSDCDGAWPVRVRAAADLGHLRDRLSSSQVAAIRGRTDAIPATNDPATRGIQSLGRGERR